jgi:hypothetical protein
VEISVYETLQVDFPYLHLTFESVKHRLNQLNFPYRMIQKLNRKPSSIIQLSVLFTNENNYTFNYNVNER